MALAILLIPIEQDAGGDVEIKLVALLQSVPAALVSFCIQGHLGVWGMGDVVEEDEMSRFIELLGTDAVLSQGKADLPEGKACFF